MWWKKYSSIVLQSMYWISFCSLYSYAAVFLLHSSFSSASIGFLMAGASLLAVFLQPLIGSWVDKPSLGHGGSRLKQTSVVIVILVLLSELGLLVTRAQGVMTTLLYFVALVSIIILQPFFSAMILAQADLGVRVNFGVARAAGSFFFALGSVGIGLLIEAYSPGVLPYVSVVLLLLLLTVTVIYPEGQKMPDDESKMREPSEVGVGFFKKYPGFWQIWLGLSLVFVFHTMAGVFLINIITDRGGLESQLGFALMLMAVVEIPVMVASNRLIARYGTSPLFIFAMLFFIVRSVALLMSRTIVEIYIAQLLQAFCFAIYIPVSVAFVNNWMTPTDKVKGQTLIVSATTLGSVTGSVLGGVIIDLLGVNAMLMVGCVATALGTVFVIWGLKAHHLGQRIELKV